ncbi:MAG TPA: hypothetical protein VGT03_13365 [Candidatus Acidoferrales bacterium]|nr:hypothetical protein [Candidatus Acidoferrales bacterium]
MPANRLELLATWYLRFNGFFTTPNFTEHPDYRKQPGGTDADVLAVRFPYSEERQRRFVFERDGDLIRPDRVDFLICEVKRGKCGLNDTWRKPERHSVEYAIRFMGFDGGNGRISEMAATVYKSGCFEWAQQALSARFCVRFVCFGAVRNLELESDLPGAQQILHKEQVIEFLRGRFTKGCEGITRENWDPEIIKFAELCRTKSNEQLFEWAIESRATS